MRTRDEWTPKVAKEGEEEKSTREKKAGVESRVERSGDYDFNFFQRPPLLNLLLLPTDIFLVILPLIISHLANETRWSTAKMSKASLSDL